MKNHVMAAVGLLGLLLLAGCATATSDKAPTATAATSQTATQAAVPEMKAGDVLTATFTVQAVDLKNRLVTLKNKQGKSSVIQVSEEVRNLPQVKVGDRVTVQYHEAVALKINRDTSGGIAKKTETISAGRAELGQKPGGNLRKTTEIIANILAIDSKSRNITFQGPERILVVKAPADKNLSNIDVGDQVLLTYVEELAVTVESAKPAKPAKSAKLK
ncbi:MAG: hypothetical protein HC889_13870 [Synechococcaceae cyanobacterium SM1_2_3]|nr:hypothetical protein [Synechococcaceae cyanobacterium SM1_2_3]